MKVISAAIKLGSTEAIVRAGLKLQAQYFNKQGNQAIEIGETEHEFIYRQGRCPICCGWTADEPVCYSTVGYLRAALAWATGKQSRIVETECRARGDEACVFLIDKKPIEEE